MLYLIPYLEFGDMLLELNSMFSVFCDSSRRSGIVADGSGIVTDWSAIVTDGEGAQLSVTDCLSSAGGHAFGTREYVYTMH